jgi:hypothetical protein
MFTISNTVVKTLQGFFENFAREGIAKVPNEDVRLATEQILAVAERLAESLLYQLNVQFKYWKGSPNALLTFSDKLLAICWSVNA